MPPSNTRACPQDPKMKSCWWVRSGNPHEGEGHGCVCQIPVEDWVPSTPANTGMDDVDAVLDLLVAQHGLVPEALAHIVRITRSRQDAIDRVIGRTGEGREVTPDGR